MNKFLSLTAIGCFISVGTTYATPNTLPDFSLVDKNVDVKALLQNRDLISQNIMRESSLPMEITDVITEVEGKNAYMTKSSSGFFVNYYLVYPYDDNSLASSIVFGENNEVYFKNILTLSELESYAKGEIKGNEIIMSLPQTMIYNPINNLGLNLCVVKYEANEDGSIYCETQNEIDSIVFTIDEDGSITLNLPGEPGEYMLGLSYSDNSQWAYYGDFHQIYYPLEGEIFDMPADIEPILYTMPNGSAGYAVEVAAEGDYIYLKGLCEKMPECVIRADYDSQNGKAFIPQNQLMGIYNGIYFIVTKVVFYEPSGYYYFFASKETPYVLDVDADNYIIKSAEAEDPNYVPFLCFNAAGDQLSYLQLLQNFEMKGQTSFAGIPANPYNINLLKDFLSLYGFYSFCFNIPNISTTGTLLNLEGLYFTIYLDGEPLEFVYDEAANAYSGIAEETTEIPYNFTNLFDIFAAGGYREIGIYAEGFETIGVQLIYKYNDTLTYSDTMTYDVITGKVTSGVEGTYDKSVSYIEYYDLQGRRILYPSYGIYIQKIVLSDGSIMTRKISK